jgi:precorrin-8X/cobalt-precorrin-8 methylmutase
MKTYTRPADIENESMRIISAELKERGIEIPGNFEAVVKRVIHATADFEYAKSLTFVCGKSIDLHQKTIITDTNMALSGLSKPSLQKLGCEAFCFMADPGVAAAAKENGTTRAVASMEYAAERYPGAVFAVGNAPTALFKLAELMEGGLRPALVIAVPVGFVNVVEGKEEILRACREYEVPAIVARGRKGGSTVAAAILNALLYEAAGMLAPESRGW